MKYLIIIFFILFACQKDGVYYKPTPDVTLSVTNVTAKSAELHGFVSGQDSVIRGFLISKYNVPDLTRPDNDIIWADKGVGEFVATPELEHNQVYWVCAFCYYPRFANRVTYGNTVILKTL